MTISTTLLLNVFLVSDTTGRAVISLNKDTLVVKFALAFTKKLKMEIGISAESFAI